MYCATLYSPQRSPPNNRYDDSEAPTDKQLALIKREWGAFELLQARAAQVQQQQTLFGSRPFDFQAADRVKRDLASHEAKWKLLHDFRSTAMYWMESDVEDLDAGDVESKFDAMKRENAKAMKAAGADPIRGVIQKEVAELEGKLPVLLEVASPALKERHWKQIVRVLQGMEAATEGWEDTPLPDEITPQFLFG